MRYAIVTRSSYSEGRTTTRSFESRPEAERCLAAIVAEGFTILVEGKPVRMAFKEAEILEVADSGSEEGLL